MDFFEMDTTPSDARDALSKTQQLERDLAHVVARVRELERLVDMLLEAKYALK